MSDNVFDYAPELLRLDAVKPEPLQWLWPGRIPSGKITLLYGDPGLGKSFITLDVASRVSTGAAWPDLQSEPNQRGGVLLLSAEDDMGDTIVPRLSASGADLRYIHVMTGITERTEEGIARWWWNLARVETLEAAVQQIPDCRLIVIDPISAYLDGVDSHKNTDVRGLLGPLATMASQKGVAVLAVTHLNKGGAGGSALYRATGSLAFIAAARAGWLVAKDQAIPARRLFLPTKNNLAPDGGGLAFTLTQIEATGPPVVTWEPDPIRISADDALAIPRDHPGPDPEKCDAAEDWLTVQLELGAVATASIRREAEAAGFAWRTVQRAAERIGVLRTKSGYAGGWSWQLSSETEDATFPHLR